MVIDPDENNQLFSWKETGDSFGDPNNHQAFINLFGLVFSEAKKLFPLSNKEIVNSLNAYLNFKYITAYL